MQIFLLDYDVELNAQYYMDKHVIKIPAEIQKVLFNACIRVGAQPPKIIHNDGSSEVGSKLIINHPICKWACESSSNFMYLKDLGVHLCVEYECRFGAEHFLKRNFELFPELEVKGIPPTLTGFPLMFPKILQRVNLPLGIPVISHYREYYITNKQQLAIWSPPRQKPYWYSNFAVKEGELMRAALERAKLERKESEQSINLSSNQN